jgi:hypothetical protein
MEQIGRLEISVVRTTLDLALLTSDNWTYKNLLDIYQDEFSALHQPYLRKAKAIAAKLPFYTSIQPAACAAVPTSELCLDIDTSIVSSIINKDNLDYVAAVQLFKSVIQAVYKAIEEAKDVFPAAVVAITFQSSSDVIILPSHPPRPMSLHIDVMDIATEEAAESAKQESAADGERRSARLGRVAVAQKDEESENSLDASLQPIQVPLFWFYSIHIMLLCNNISYAFNLGYSGSNSQATSRCNRLPKPR